jgi:hypothetical protein
MFVRQIIEKSPDIRIQNPVHLLPHDPRRQRVPCIMGAGGPKTITLTTALVNWFKAAIAFSVSTLPKGVTAKFAPASVASPGSGTSTLTLSVAAGTAAGTCTMTVTAKGGNVIQTQVISLTY